ncbi:SHC-transforming protein 1-like isoform X2 [Mytilus californianus]|uniref:SHC-transforming protein 1-like isoform X2 n=1 Tax=Mytilus californianus TaxID=6549 RepID=UPI002248380F|nr:SHC-transforming protein 1-like isoform X2 [Mytilus californianus]
MCITLNIMDKHKKGKKQPSEWSKTGSFMHKPERGWIHPDAQIKPDAGVCYGVRYIGCLEVKESMRQLDFDTRTALAREAICRVCEAAGLKTAKKRKVDKKLVKMLGDAPKMQYAGSNVNLTITTDCLTLIIMESGEMIANHQMPGISFASGGDSETLDFVAYVAKDAANGRACHVLECGGGLAEDVITTIGQAFELRFKEYLKNQPKPVTVQDPTEKGIADSDAWGNDESDYYNDRPDARPPLAEAATGNANYSAPKSNLPISDGLYASVKEPPQLYDVPKDQPLIDFGATGGQTYDNKEGQVYDNKESVFNGDAEFEGNMYDNKENVMEEPTTNGDAFDMNPFQSSLQNTETEPELPQRQFASDSMVVHEPSRPEIPQRPQPKLPEEDSIPKHNIAPMFETWYHGQLPRKQAEKLLQKDGDFLVRKSSNDQNQYVLSGRQNGVIKHLLLVDPDGIVRTKDHTFESVPHLIKYHMKHGLPIVSQESELHLVRPVSNNYTNC